MQQVGGIEDSSAPPGDLLVAQAVDLVQKLLLPAPGIDQVGMRVAERRKEHALFGIDHLVGGDLAQLVHAPVSRKTVVVNQQPRIVEAFQPVHLRTADPETARRFDADDAADIFHQQLHSVCRNWIEASIWGYITSSLSMNGTRCR